MGQGKNGRVFIGTCSKCREKLTKVVKFKNSQLCVAKCLPSAIERLGGAPAPEAVPAPAVPQVVSKPTSKPLSEGWPTI